MEEKFDITEDLFIDNDINPESYLWKFVSIEKFLSLIINEELHLTRLDLFDDKQEAVSHDYLKVMIRQEEIRNSPLYKGIAEYHTIIVDGKKQNALKEVQQKTQQSNFASCWYLSDDAAENVAMWNLYSSSNSVAINIRYKDFKQSLLQYGVNNDIDDFEELTFSKVHYYNFNDKKILEEIINNSSVFVKDKSFAYEKEFRIIAKKTPHNFKPFVRDKSWIPNDTYEKLEANLDCKAIKLELQSFKKYPFKIVFHPKCQEWVKKDIIKILAQFEIPFKTTKSVVQLR